MIISKLDNELSQLLKAQITFFNNPESQATLTITLNDGDINDYIDEKLLKREIEDLCDLKMVMAERIFLEETGRLRKEFVSYFNKNKYVVPSLIKNKGKIEEITVSGNLVDLILLEYPITVLVREHVIQQQCKVDNVLYDAYIVEAVRRMETKLDLIREVKGFNIYLGGCRDRVSYDWAATIMVTLAGDVKEKIIGTNYLLGAFVLGFPTEAFLDDAMWIEDWDKKDIALSPKIEDALGWEGARVSIDKLDPGQFATPTGEPFKLLIDGSNIYDAIHFIQHNREKDVIVELDKGFLSDLGYNWKDLKITKKISK